MYLRLPGFESCIQQRKTSCLISIRKSLACTRMHRIQYMSFSPHVYSFSLLLTVASVVGKVTSRWWRWRHSMNFSESCFLGGIFCELRNLLEIRKVLGFTSWWCFSPNWISILNRFFDWFLNPKSYVFIRLGLLRWVPIACRAGRWGLKLRITVRPVNVAHWIQKESYRVLCGNISLYWTINDSCSTWGIQEYWK